MKIQIKKKKKEKSQKEQNIEKTLSPKSPEKPKDLSEIPRKDSKEEGKYSTKIPSFDEFINLSYEEFGVNCNKFITKFFSNNIYFCSLIIFSKNRFNLEIKVQKKLSDFEKLYKLINSKYSKMNFQPPPTFSFLVKDEEYMNYFDNLLNDIIRTAKSNEEMKSIFLKFI
jgi:hypothetical protein